MEEWNSDEWQGKRKDQIQFSLYGAVIGFVGMIIVTYIYFLLR